MVSGKGKEKVTDGGGKGKRKSFGGGDDDKTGRKRKNRGALQFFEDEAYQVDESEDSSDDSMFNLDDFLEDEFSSDFKANNEPAKVPNLPFVKVEDMSDEELDRMLEERYKPGAGFVTYMEDGYDHKKSIDRNIYIPSAKDPIIWKVKCMVGRERYSAFCLMQKFADMVYLGAKLQVISACAVDHVKGFIFIEAEKQQDIYEACKGLSSVYSSRVTAVPNNELSRLLSVRSKSSGISEGMWARVKNGKYKGDLAQVVSVNHIRKKVTVKLVPRIDLKAMAEKFGGGITGRRTAIPAQRLISSSELEEFRPLIQSRRDRDTNLMFEILDGMMLKDGYLYKKVSIDSLSFWGTLPTEDELLKFEASKKDESMDVQWLSQLFGEKEKKKKEVKIVKDKGGGGKSEGSSSACMGNNFELHDLVFFGRKDFGVVIGSEKDHTVKVLKEGSEGPSVVTVKQNELKSATFDKKLFSVLDQHSNTLSVNDIVRVLEGPLKDRQGIVKKIYKGILFLCDESEQENDGYICVKARLCEKVNLSGDASNEKDNEPGPSGFADISSSPKSPLSPDKSWQDRDNKSNFKRDDNEIFSVGQSLRIRVGPLKGYRCRVLAVRRSDVTVKLDSQQKILTVKSEHLSEVRERNSAIGHGDESGSMKSFDFLGAQDGTRDWMDGAVLSTEGDKWNAGGSTESSSWSALPSSNPLLSRQSGSDYPVGDSAKEGAEDSSWQVKATSDQNSSWGAAAANSKMVTDTASLDGWGKSVQPEQDGSGETLKDDSWGVAAKKSSTGGDISGSNAAWGQSGLSSGPETSAWKKDSDALDKSKESTWPGTAVANESRWGNKGNVDKDGSLEGWGKGGSTWGNKDSSGGTGARGNAGGASSQVDGQTGSWAKSAEAKTEGSSGGSGAWGNAGGAASQVDGETGSWTKPAEGKTEDISAWGKQDGGSSWNKQDGGSSGKGESSWGKSGGKSSCGQQADVNEGDYSGKRDGSGGGRGFGGWKNGGMGNRDEANQDNSWGRSKPFDGGRGSGGRWGRGRGRGGNDQYGRGSSFDRGQSTSWNKEVQYAASSDAGKNSSWSSDQPGGWRNANSNEGSKKSDGWGKANVSDKDEASKDNNSSGWSVPRDPNNSNTSDWGKSSNANEESGAASSWGEEQKTNENNLSSWNTSTPSLDENQSSDWGKKVSWGSQKGNEEAGVSWGKKPNEDTMSSWKTATTSLDENKSSEENNGWSSLGKEKNGSGSSMWKDNGGSSTGWGQSNWLKNETNASGGNQDSTWSSKSNWNSDNQDNNTFSDSGRGGGWRSGRGGRGDRGGFRGRGGSDRGGFGGRGGGYGGRGGGFGGREGSDRGGFGGRGGSDREGFRGRGGGFRGGRGRGDWNNRGDDSNVDKSYSWGKGSNNDGEGWKSGGNGGGSWTQRDGDKNLSQTWSQSKGDASQWGGSSSWNQAKGDSSTAGEWSKANDSNKDAQQSDTSQWGGSSSWNQGKGNSSTAGEWGKANDSKETGTSVVSDVGQSKESDEGPSDGWGKAAPSSWGNGGGKGGW